ncbi:hypothetical protein H6G17_02690 [Chroococcidiopsis sp. FACHB-1243]|uniref:hypothetical protein n=1 Tax=Chroococcidiopsis sp. [FACHB-1243] TaxID=2692781 RepID=UPI00177C9BF2|nr:hypothetical protein [Chroococcidiopsis sp. [FACHB-1243]]MBD2304429.1 hypothetical protein [Chroococcidiopsis sp. [FACHB-1243]]
MSVISYQLLREQGAGEKRAEGAYDAEGAEGEKIPRTTHHSLQVSRELVQLAIACHIYA